MKRVIILLSALLVFAVAGNAQSVQPFSLYVGGALSVPTSPDGFKDTYNTGYHGSLGAGYKFAPNFQVVGKAEYHHFSFDLDDASGVDGGENKLWMFGADGRYSLNMPTFPMKPFFFGGVGMANISFGDFSGSNTTLVTALNDQVADESETKMYFNFGGGGEFKLGPTWSFFAQARYVSVQTEGDSWVFIPFTLGLKFF